MGCGSRSISPAETNRSTIRPVADGCTPNRLASVARLIEPRLDKITSVRNCGMVMVSSTWEIERADMATSSRDAVSNASVIVSSDSPAAVALSVPIVPLFPGGSHGTVRLEVQV